MILNIESVALWEDEALLLENTFISSIRHTEHFQNPLHFPLIDTQTLSDVRIGGFRCESEAV